MAEAQANPPTGTTAASRRASARDDTATNGEHRSFAGEASHAHEAAKHSDEMMGVARNLSRSTAQATREAAASWRGAMEPFFGLPMEMNRWFNELWGQAGMESVSGLRPARPFAAWSMAPLLGLPLADVKETREAYQLCVELPGLTREDIELQTEGDTLVVSGQKSEGRSDTVAAYRVSERRFGRFERRFPIPSEVERDQIKAAFRDGVLTITLPKAANADQGRNRIEIQG